MNMERFVCLDGCEVFSGEGQAASQTPSHDGAAGLGSTVMSYMYLLFYWYLSPFNVAEFGPNL